MSQAHLSEHDIQQVAMGIQQADPLQEKHLQACTACRNAVASYQAMFTSLKTMAPPVFDFDVEQLVMPQLPAPQEPVAHTQWPLLLVICVAVVIFFIPLFIMSSFLLNLAKGIPAFTLYIILTTTLVIAGFLGREMMTSYREKMRLLNFY